LFFSNLTELGQNQFSRLESLEELHLQVNSIHLLHQGAFHGLHALRHLSLAANNIKALHAGVFAGTLKPLTYLHM
jgi:hypothetical protein